MVLAMGNTAAEAEQYLEVFKNSIDIWSWVNQQLNKYRHMPWLND